MKQIDGGVTAPAGFRASGVSAGIKNSRADLALVVSDVPAVTAGVFTTNKVKAAPVRLCAERLRGAGASAIVVNSGNANACTGERGMEDAIKMAELAGAALGIEQESVLVCSTGTIGVPLPMAKLEAGIPAAAQALSEDGGQSAAEAIMTTDTVPKTAAVELEAGGSVIRIGAMVKGAGMIEPNMATMLAFLTTDADVDRDALQKCLSHAVAGSFNRITVDGDQSTNDTVLFLANGKAENETLDETHPDWSLFAGAVEAITLDLAKKIVRDGEGATKFVTVKTVGAASDDDALKVCRAIANSLLVKTSWFGEDPNWGRVIDAAGYSGAELDPDRVDIFYDGFCAVKDGCAADGSVKEGILQVIRSDEFVITVDLDIGKGSDVVYACDCSHDYVKINSDYMT